MKHSLLCTNQVRYNGIIVDDTPKIIDVLNKSHQAIIIPKDDEDDIHIPISLHGPVPYVPVRKPTKDELYSFEHIILTNLERWDPSLFLSDTNHNISDFHFDNGEKERYENVFPDALKLAS